MNSPLGFLIFFLVFLSILSSGHYWTYKTYKKYLYPEKALLNKFLKIFLIASPLGFIVSNYLTRQFYNFFTIWSFRIFAFTLGLFFWLFLTSLVLRLLGFLNSKKQFINIQKTAIFFIIFSVIISFYGLSVALNPKIVRLTIPAQNLPESWKDKNIVFISDSHFGQIYTEKHAQKIAQKIQNLNPEIVLIGGDFFDGPKTNYLESAKIFGRIKSTYGTFFISGNHENYITGINYLTVIKEAGINVLQDEKINLSGLEIIGLSYENNLTETQILENLKKIQPTPSSPNILIKHVPFHIDIPDQFNIDLQLYGHTHNGQMFPNSLITKWIYKGYNYGLKATQNGLVYTSSGVGGWGPPIRVGTQSEIILINLQ